jgi:tetratricopeptide (TPR) repeat protein
VDREPESAWEWWQRGRSHAERARYREALRCFERAIALDPTLADPPQLAAELVDIERRARRK